MKDDAFEIVDVAPKPMKPKPRLPVLNGRTRAERMAALASEEAIHDVPTEEVSAEASILDAGHKPMKKPIRLPPKQGRALRERGSFLLAEKASVEAPAKMSTPETSLISRSKGGEAREKVAHPEQAKEALGKGRDCTDLLERCRLEAAKATASEDEASRNVETALAGIAELKRLVAANPAAEEELLQAYGAAGIRITKRTANQFTPLVKLVFPKKAQKPATVSRYAGVLRFAEEENIKTSGFVDFVRRNGGLAACASRASENRRNSADGSRQARTGAAEALKARRLNAPRLQLPLGIALPKESPIALLVEPGPKGSWLILGYRCAPAGAVASSLPVSARPSGAAEGKRR